MTSFKFVFIFICFFFFSNLYSGCTGMSNYLTKYIEGTSLTIGLWLPLNGQIYGLQAFNYLSGKSYCTSDTNKSEICTSSNITNDFFGSNSIISQKTRINEKKYEKEK